MSKTHSPGFLKIVEEAKQKIRETTIPVVADRLARGDKFHFVDVREDDEYRAGHARGAVHIGKGVIERDIETKIPAKDDEIVVYCGGGFRSALAAEVLGRMGYTNVHSMDGGMRGWREAKLPEETS
ncbi:MAG: rhodanese-like domain-containing protein [Myxococcota bacterium]|nr:sulfurtransferase [Deltaproteobacteria bacterium]MDQ3336888.1 rhodanese-like domain-containing protein [Myxococcota bacterium]